MTERRTFVVRVRDAGALTVEDVDRQETRPLADLHELPAWIERRLEPERGLDAAHPVRRVERGDLV